MRQLLNTLFVTSEDIYLSLDGENVVANRGEETVARYPLHTLQSIVTFSYAGASPALMGKCAQREIGLAFCSQRGKFLARVSGQMQGNVLLRRMQYRVADDPPQSCRIARNMIFGKVYNARWSVERTRRDHAPRVDGQRFSVPLRTLADLRRRGAGLFFLQRNHHRWRAGTGIHLQGIQTLAEDAPLRRCAATGLHGQHLVELNAAGRLPALLVKI